MEAKFVIPPWLYTRAIVRNKVTREKSVVANIECGDSAQNTFIETYFLAHPNGSITRWNYTDFINTNWPTKEYYII